MSTMQPQKPEEKDDDRWWDDYFVISRWLRRRWKADYVDTIEHWEVAGHVREEGQLTSRYAFMATMSCAIAMLGLLLSSPAVVIGAMLISPLMGPIVSLGFSLCLLDIRQMKKALEGVVSGMALALAISWLIVTLSPLTDPTPEILARTQPNLFDLLVAIFSGLAGGYAVTKRKGEAIVGVAIATALMPPLAVVGFGIATGSGAIAGGAFMLFMTNLLAIALSVTIIAKFYGFGSRHGKKHTAWQAALVVAVFGALSFPLGIALKDIAYQTYMVKTAKNAIAEYFGDKSSRISLFNIQFPEDGTTSIDTVVLTPKYRSDAQADLGKILSEKTSRTVLVALDQVVVAQNVIKKVEEKPLAENIITPAIQPTTPKLNKTEEMTQALRQKTVFPTEFIKVDIDSRQASIYPKPSKGVGLATLREMETQLALQYPEWTIRMVPPVQALPPIYFTMGATTPPPDEMDKLADIIWTLKHWKVEDVVVVGFASTVGEFERFNNTSLAYRRAQSVVKALENEDISASPKAEYKSFKQQKDERFQGINRFQRVEIRLAHIPQLDTSPKTADMVISDATPLQ